MRFHVRIILGNDAMRDGAHIARALREVAEQIEHITHEGLPSREDTIIDENGNTTGKWWVEGRS